jgi:hypothetical protein
MMVNSDAISFMISGSTCTHPGNHSGGLVAQGQRSAWGKIPFHGVCHADPAGLCLHKKLTGTWLRDWTIFNPYITIVIVNSYFHGLFGSNPV